MDSLKLVEPSVIYKDSFLAAVREFESIDGKTYRDIDVDEASKDFAKFIEKVNIESAVDQNEHVPMSVFWLVNEGSYIGRLSLRHRLNDNLHNFGGHIGYDIRPSMRRKGFGYHILSLGLEKARARGLEKVLLTCDTENEGSRKIIESQGGVYEDSRTDSAGIVKRRYWITIS